MFKFVLLSLVIASFFSLIGKEGRAGPRAWWLISFGLFWITHFFFTSIGLPGVLIAVVLEAVLFLVVSIIWVMTPRRSAAQIRADAERDRAQRDDQRLLRPQDGR